MKYIQPLIKFVKNKYIIAFTAFLVWMLFFDPKDIGLMIGRTKKLNDLNKSEQHLTKQIKETKTELKLLSNDAASIEKYARENFLMKKENEDLFIVKTP